MSSIILEAKSLTKEYKQTLALDHINLQIKKGKIYGFIGQNGAGKTTFLRLVTGLAFPTSGTLSLWGNSGTEELQKQRKRIGSMIETPALFPSMTAYQNMEVQRIQRGIPDKSVIKRTLDMVGLQDTGKKSVRNFSLGMRQRLGIAIALLNTPERQAVAGVLRNEEYLKESVANISHDLRTPLTVILGHLQLLQKENLESSQAQRVKVIFSKAEKMKELVETFYDLSILEEQQTVPEKEKFNISNMLINLITENAVALEKENILPEINLPDYSIYVYSDKNMVERILQNLLTNAIKYSVGTIKITLMEKENNNIIFTIENPMSDSSEIDCNRLFDRFYTGDKSRHNGSTGLGLAVVKTLVAILGGNIVAKVHANSLIITLEL